MRRVPQLIPPMLLRLFVSFLVFVTCFFEASSVIAQGVRCSSTEIQSVLEKEKAADESNFWKALWELSVHCGTPEPLTALSTTDLSNLTSLIRSSVTKKPCAGYTCRPAVTKISEVLLEKDGTKYFPLLLKVALESSEDKNHKHWAKALGPPLLQYYLRRQLEELPSLSAGVRQPAPAATPYPGSVNTPAGRETWNRSAGFVERFSAQSSTDPAQQIAFQEHEDAFWAIVLRYFNGENAATTLQKISTFGWLGGCGTGSDSFLGPLNLLKWSLFSAQKDWPAAVGAAIESHGSHHLGAHSSSPLVRDFFGKAALNWEQMFLSMSMRGDREALRYLGAEGGESAAQGLITLRDELRRDNSSLDAAGYIHAVGAMISPACDVGRSSISSAEVARAKIAYPQAETQTRLAAILADLSRDLGRHPRGGDLVEPLAYEIGRLCRTDMLGAAQLLARSPNRYAREHLQPYFRKLGQELPVASESEKVAFRLLVNGSPLTAAKVGWESSRPVKPGEYGGGSTSSSATVGPGGVVTLDRSVLYPGGKLAFSTERYSPSDTEAPLFFFKQIDLSVAPGEIPSEIVVPIESGSVKIEFSGAPPTPSLTRGVVIRPVQQFSILNSMAGYSFQSTLGQEFEYGLVDGSVIVPLLPPGDYTICAHSPGWARVCSSNVRIEAGTEAAVRLKMTKGADVKFTVSKRDTGEKLPYPVLELHEQGAPKPLNLSNFASGDPLKLFGLPVGKYQLKVGAQPPRFERGRGEIPESVKGDVIPQKSYKTSTIDFVIDGASPVLVDLGEVRLELSQRDQLTSARH